MAYTITTSMGDTIGTIPDGELNTTTTSLQLIGRNYSNYGQVMVDNLVWLLENFADSTAPSAPIQGQLWWDTTNSKLKVRMGTGISAGWKVVNGCTNSTSSPGLQIQGDLWWRTDTEQLFAYTGTEWKLIGPGWEKDLGKSGAFWEQITGDDAAEHTVLALYSNGIRVEIINKDSTFTPQTAIPGFATVPQGIVANTAIASGTFWGTANNASYLGDQPAANFWRNNQDNSGTGSLTVANDTGISVGSDADLTLSVTGDDVEVKNNTSNGDMTLGVKVGSTDTTLITLKGTSGVVEVAADPTTDLGISTKKYVDDHFIDSDLLGVPTANTAAAGTNTTQLATTAFVFEANAAVTGYVNSINNSRISDLSLKANIANPALTGTPTAPTASPGTNSTQLATTAFVYEANLSLKGYVDSIDASKAPLASPALVGVPTAPTMPPGTANTAIATTDFVINNSGFLKNKIYEDDSYFEISDTGIPSANLVLNGTTLMTASTSGISLKSGATAVTIGQSYSDSGNTVIATTSYVKTATTWWGGSAKFISTDAPNPGVNDIGSNDGDFWFQREV